MSNVSEEENFRVFTSKKSRNRQKYKQNTIKTHINTDFDDFDLDETIRSINSHLIDFEGTDYYIELLEQLETVVNKLKADYPIILYCLGLGRFSSDFTAKLQFIYVVLLAKRFSIENLYFYDPVFSVNEKELLDKFGYTALNENNEGKFTISRDALNIVFFPHCPIELTNNFLWKNWSAESLKRIIYIGNSFETIVTNTITRKLKNIGKFIKLAERFVDEIRFDEPSQNSRYTGVFNNTSIHVFWPGKLIEQPDHFWHEIEEPIYETTEEEFIKNGI